MRAPSADRRDGRPGAGVRRLRRAGRGRRSLLGVLAAAALALPWSRAAAQREPPPEGRWRFIADPFAGLHLFGPVRASFTALVGAGTSDHDVPGLRSSFVFAIAEPGLDAGRLSLAWARFFGWNGGMVARATWLRVWDGSRPRQYAGVEAQWLISVLPLGVRLGAFRPLAAADGTKRIVWMADLSVMY